MRYTLHSKICFIPCFGTSVFDKLFDSNSIIVVLTVRVSNRASHCLLSNRTFNGEMLFSNYYVFSVILQHTTVYMILVPRVTKLGTFTFVGLHYTDYNCLKRQLKRWKMKMDLSSFGIKSQMRVNIYHSKFTIM